MVPLWAVNQAPFRLHFVWIKLALVPHQLAAKTGTGKQHNMLILVFPIFSP